MHVCLNYKVSMKNLIIWGCVQLFIALSNYKIFNMFFRGEKNVDTSIK